MNRQFSSNLDVNQVPNLCINDTVYGESRRLEPLNYPAEAPLHSMKGRTFLPIRSGTNVFCTDEWDAKGTMATFQPVQDDMLVNLTKYDQISATHGTYLTGDASGNFQRSLFGQVLHLWRFDKVTRKQYTAQSFLFANNQDLNIFSRLLKECDFSAATY